MSFAIRHCGSRLLLLRLEGIYAGHDGVPNDMVTLKGDGFKDYLKSVSMRVLLANDVP